MLTGAIVASVAYLLFRMVLLSFDYEAKVLARKGIAPDSMPDRRVRLLTTRGCMWFFGALAIVLWVGTLLKAWL